MSGVELVTERLRLRRLSADDLPAVARLLGDGRVMKRIDDGRPVPEDVVAGEWWAAVVDEYATLPAGFGRLAVVRRMDGEWLGIASLRRPSSAGLTGVEVGAAVVELGYRLLPEHWGEGYASEAARALVGAAFREPWVMSVVATTMTVNRASVRVLERAGLTYVRTFFGDWEQPLPGAEEGDVVYAVSRAEWESARGGVAAGAG